MSATYTANEKRLAMFGTQAQGYAIERVDMYLDKLEGAYTQCRAAYEQAKAAAAPAAETQSAQLQELLGLNAKLQQENQALLAENDALRAKLTELETRITQLAERPQPQPSAEGTIARALLAAQEKAEDILRGAQLEAQGIVATAHNQLERLDTEKSRAIKQLEGIRFALDGLLREPTAAMDAATGL